MPEFNLTKQQSEELAWEVNSLYDHYKDLPQALEKGLNNVIGENQTTKMIKNGQYQKLLDIYQQLY